MREALFAIVLLIGGCVCTVKGEWYEFAPEGANISQGILRDVISHCDEQGRRTAYEPDYVTYCHEATHMVNSRVRQVVAGARKNAFYVGGNRVCVLVEPNCRLSDVAPLVAQQFRNSTYQLYFVDQQKYWNDCPLYILDEWTAYCNGAQAANELGVDPHGEFERVQWFCHYADCVVAAVKQRDPNYAQLKELVAFVDWQKQRAQAMLGQTTTAPANQCIGGQCFIGGGCNTGACGQPQYQQPMRVISKPVVKPIPAPTFQPLSPPPPVTTPAIAGPPGPPGKDGKDGSDATCECGPKWAGLDIRLGLIESSLTKIKEQKPPEAPALPQAEQHVVVIADHNAPYWQHLAAEIERTKRTYHGVQESTLPPFLEGIHPQAVVYRNSIPIRIVKGQYPVEDLLARLSRGDPI